MGSPLPLKNNSITNLVTKDRFPACRMTWLALLAIGLMGCSGPGPEVRTVHGTLSLDGEPLTGVLVSFVAQDGGRAASGTSNEQGKYRLVCRGDEQGAVLRKHRVRFFKLEGEFSQDHRSDGGKQQASPSRTANWVNNAELTVEVRSGDNNINFQFSSVDGPRVIHGQVP